MAATSQGGAAYVFEEFGERSRQEQLEGKRKGFVMSDLPVVQSSTHHHLKFLVTVCVTAFAREPQNAFTCRPMLQLRKKVMRGRTSVPMRVEDNVPNKVCSSDNRADVHSKYVERVILERLRQGFGLIWMIAKQEKHKFKLRRAG